MNENIESKTIPNVDEIAKNLENSLNQVELPMDSQQVVAPDKPKSNIVDLFPKSFTKFICSMPCKLRKEALYLFSSDALPPDLKSQFESKIKPLEEELEINEEFLRIQLASIDVGEVTEGQKLLIRMVSIQFEAYLREREELKKLLVEYKVTQKLNGGQ